jgi:hypothetical protein
LFREGHVPDQQPSDAGTSIDFTGGGDGLDDEDIF